VIVFSPNTLQYATVRLWGGCDNPAESRRDRGHNDAMAAPRRRSVKVSDLTTSEAAALAGIKPRTWSAYVARGQAPPPVARIGNTPVWDRSHVEHWLANRPGQGSRRRG